ncbi:MAG: histidine phosphatase family protein [Ruminococcaceae bacterium]|nr:histidine phosphatase family protein [Oscillospiraceae bacterium]
MRVYLVRHGQSAANLTNSFAGWLDVPLTDSGKQDGSNAGNFLR